MNVFSSLFSRTLNPAWSHTCEATLWRLLIGDRGRIVGECRDQEKKETAFFCLEEQSGTVLWSYESREESWWIGLEAVHENRAFLHGFESPDMPEHKKIIALDLETGEEVWRNDEVTFWFAFGKKVYAYQTRFEKRVGKVLDLESGSCLEDIEEIEALLPVRQLSRNEDAHEQIDFPEIVDRDTVPSDVLSFINRETRNQEIVGGIEAVLKDQVAVVNYHRLRHGSQLHEPLLENRLLVFDRKEGKRVFSDILLREARAPVPDAFFVKDDSLFFIKDQHILTMLPLPHFSEGSFQ